MASILVADQMHHRVAMGDIDIELVQRPAAEVVEVLLYLHLDIVAPQIAAQQIAITAEFVLRGHNRRSKTLRPRQLSFQTQWVGVPCTNDEPDARNCYIDKTSESVVSTAQLRSILKRHRFGTRHRTIGRKRDGRFDQREFAHA